MGWNQEQTSVICRERLGGGSYLTHSIVPMSIEGAHSGMTAEGDNRVLMQKVVKDILTDMQKKLHKMPELTQCPKREIPGLKSISN
jgi:acyl-CoA oxidase